MSDKIENLFNLTNYRDHPEDKDYIVFFHYNMDQANYFESLLKKEGIEFESFLEEEAKKPVMLFAIHKKRFRKALVQNELSYASFKKPFIPFKWLRYSLLIIIFILTLIALIGYIKSK